MSKMTPLQPDLVQIAWALNIYRLATSIIGVFVPLIIISSGGRLWTVGLFYLVYAFVKLSINYMCLRLIQARGAYFGLGIGFIFSALQMTGILGYSHYHHIGLLIAASISFALTNGFLWNTQHYFISKYMVDANKSSSIASIEVYGRFGDITGPVIGGIVGALFGASWLLLASLLCMVATIIPLRKMKNLSTRDDKAEPFAYNLRGAPVSDLIANFSFNIETLIGKMAWPVYLAVVLHGYKSIGSVATIAAFASIVTTSIAGRRGDKGKDRSVLRQGVTASSIIDVARLAATATPFIVVVSTAYEASLAYLSNAWTSTYYHHARSKGPQYIASMEIACDLAYVIFWSVFSILAITIHSTKILFDIVFLVAAAAAWGCLLITKQIRDY